MIDRRAFIGGLAFGTVVTADVARAQPAGKVYRIGILSSGSTTSEMVGPEPQDPRINAFLRGLRELGYVYGAHFVTEPRGGEGKPERFATLTAEVIRLQVDVIVAAGPMLSAVKQATSTIPIVTTGSGDPVASGYAQSLPRPGGNITGLSLQLTETIGKRLELLKELVPGAAPVGVLWEPRVGRGSWQAAESAAQGRGWRVLSFEIRDVGEIEKAFKSAAASRAGALLVVPSGLPDAHARRIAELAVQSRLPVMYAFRSYIEAGGLISYGVDLSENYRRAAVFVDKILKGTKPADLPIEQPTKFELVINLKAARSIGLTTPPPLLSRADEVIQ